MTKPKADAVPGEGEDPQSKKPYATPGLVIYGNIAALTRAVDNMGTADGGMGMTDKS